MSTASAESCPSDILCEIITPELFQAINQCASSQLRHIYYHHSNVLDIYRQACSENVFGNQVKLNNFRHAIELASADHDLGKIKVPTGTFPIPLSRDKVIKHFHPHPADSLKLLGSQFCQQYPVATQIIIHHHWYGPDYLSEADQQQLGFSITPLNELDEETLRHLRDFVISDRFAAHFEFRQHNDKDKAIKSNDEIIAEVKQDVEFLNLPDSFINSINFPSFVDISKSVCHQNQKILKPQDILEPTESLHY